MKKILCLVLTLCLLAGTLAFVACDSSKNDDPATVMTVSLNPEVEFVLDGNGKVITVNALNEEGNLIISAQDFANVEGKTAEEATQLFVKVSAETGFLVRGSLKTENNNVEISISGDKADAEKLYNDVKTRVNHYLDEVGLTATLQQAEAISKEQLEKLVAECAPYLEEAEIKAMEYQQLLAELAESRKETAEYYSQELKTAYYEAKAYALDKAKFEVLRDKLNVLYLTGFDFINSAYNLAVNTLEEVRYEAFVKEDSIYQKALAAVRTAKTNYLLKLNKVSESEYGNEIPEAVQTELNRLKDLLDIAEQNLVTAGQTALEMLASAQAKLKTCRDNVLAALSDVDVDALVDKIAEKQTTAANEFFTSFESKYASSKESAKTAWNNMETDLRLGSLN